MPRKRKHDYTARRVALYADKNVRTVNILNAVEFYGIRRRHSALGEPDICDRVLTTNHGPARLSWYQGKGRRRVVITVRVHFPPATTVKEKRNDNDKGTTGELFPSTPSAAA